MAGRMKSMALLCAAALISLPLATAARSNDLDAPDCANATDTQTTTICAANELDEVDKELNAVYKKALAAQAEEDKLRADNNMSDAEAVKSLKTAERAWITYRDANCDAINAANLGGTGYAAFIVDCQTEMTRNRIKELKDMIGEGQ